MRQLRSVLPVLLLLLAGGSAAAQWPPEIKNLKHFPAGTEAGEVLQTMRGFAFALGVRCQYCHVGEEGQPIATFDFASDEKENKRKARVMLAMVDAINGEHLAKLGGEAQERVRVQCATCHGGVARPEQMQDLLVRAAEEGGGAAAVARYRELREEFHGSGAYDFTQTPMIQAAETLAGSDAAAAVALLDEALVHEPQSSWALGTLAGIEMRRGNREAAVAALRRILEFDPDNARVKAQIESLSAPAKDE